MPPTSFLRLTSLEPHGLWFGLALLVFAAARLGALTWHPVGLHVDEAQYWLWSQTLDWGYFSKPPGIAALIAASTALFGDSTTGIRVLSMACWLGSAAILFHLGRAMHSVAAGVWAGSLFLCTPASNLLGLVATTDSLLMLGWAGVMACAWRACPARDDAAPPPTAAGARRAWIAVGVLWGLTLESKYTAAALAPTLAVLAWRGMDRASPAHQRQAWLNGTAMVLMAVLLLAPNVGWNHAHGWPTVQHTLDITVRAAPAAGGAPWLNALGRVVHFLGGLLVLTGPGMWLATVWALRRPRSVADRRAVPAIRWAWWFVWPLAAIGLVQALQGGAQINWTAPVLLGGCLILGVCLANASGRSAGARWTLGAMLVSASGVLVVAASPHLHGWTAQTRPVDFWHKTRHWAPALAPLRDTIRQEPLPIWTRERDVLVQAAYVWRDLAPELKSWNPQAGVRHHFDWSRPARANAPAVWWLDRSPPPPALLVRWRQAEPVQHTDHGPLHLELWRLSSPTESMP